MINQFSIHTSRKLVRSIYLVSKHDLSAAFILFKAVRVLKACPLFNVIVQVFFRFPELVNIIDYDKALVVHFVDLGLYYGELNSVRDCDGAFVRDEVLDQVSVLVKNFLLVPRVSPSELLDIWAESKRIFYFKPLNHLMEYCPVGLKVAIDIFLLVVVVKVIICFIIRP